jgi:hypothetical protein
MSDVQEPAAAEGPASARESFVRIAADIANLLRCLAPPEEASEHFRRAQVEFLKGVRALIDARIEQLSAGRQKGTSVTIE